MRCSEALRSVRRADRLFYAIGTALYSSLPAACPQSLRAVVIKQALVSCPDVGRAEVAAACECLDTPA